MQEKQYSILANYAKILMKLVGLEGNKNLGRPRKHATTCKSLGVF